MAAELHTRRVAARGRGACRFRHGFTGTSGGNGRNDGKVEHVLLSTSHRDREIFYMLAMEGFEVSEIAHIKHMSESDVRNIVMCARDLIVNKLPQVHALKV